MIFKYSNDFTIVHGSVIKVRQCETKLWVQLVNGCIIPLRRARAEYLPVSGSSQTVRCFSSSTPDTWGNNKSQRICEDVEHTCHMLNS